MFYERTREVKCIEGFERKINKSKNMQDFFVYILRCNDDSYYVGHTDDIEKRMADHVAGRFEGYTSARRPVKLVFLQSFQTRDEAFFTERRIKLWSRNKKKALIDKNWEMLQYFAKKIFEKFDV